MLTSTHKSWGAAALIVALTGVAYGPAMRAGFVWDDDLYVAENRTLRSWEGLRDIWFRPTASLQYYPMSFTSFWAEYHLWGRQPFGYHLVNVALRALNAVLLWRALHPVSVESVAWISERKNVLSGFFDPAAMLAYRRSRSLTAAAAGRHWRFCPLVLVLLIWWKRGRVQRADLLELTPLLVLGVALGLVTVRMEKHCIAVAGAEWSLSVLQRCLLAGRAVWFYAGKLFWPADLTFINPRWEVDAAAPWQYSFALAASAGTRLFSGRERIGIAAGLMAPGGLRALTRKQTHVYRDAETLRRDRLRKNPGPWMAHDNLAIEFTQAGKLDEVIRHFQYSLSVQPDDEDAHHNLAVAMEQLGHRTEAISHYEQALQLRPDYAAEHRRLDVLRPAK